MLQFPGALDTPHGQPEDHVTPQSLERTPYTDRSCNLSKI